MTTPDELLDDPGKPEYPSMYSRRSRGLVVYGKPQVVLDVDLDKVQRLDDEKPWLVGAGDTHHTVYVVDEDGRLVGTFVVEGSVELKHGPKW